MSSKIRIDFLYDIVRDAKNTWESVNNDFSARIDYLIGNHYISKFRGKSWQNCRSDIICLHEEFITQNKSAVNCLLSFYRDLWQREGRAITELMLDIFGKEHILDETRSYLTFCSRCPYNPEDNSFMVSVFASPPEAIYTLAHELFHLHYFRSTVDLKATNGDIHNEDFLEAITFVIDIELRERNAWYQSGRLEHQKVGAFIEKMWLTSKDIRQVSLTTLEMIKTKCTKNDDRA